MDWNQRGPRQSSHGRNKSTQKRYRDPSIISNWPKENRINYLIAFMRDVENQPIPHDIFNILSEQFACGLKDRDMRNLWTRCKEFWSAHRETEHTYMNGLLSYRHIPSQSLQGGSGAEAAMAPRESASPALYEEKAADLPEGEVYCDRGYGSSMGGGIGGISSVLKILRRNSGSDLQLPGVVPEPAPQPTPAQVKWLSPSENIGHFFINKVQLPTSGTWQPTHIADTLTRVQAFEDVVPLVEMEKALIVTTVTLTQAISNGLIFHFPPSVELTIVCHEEKCRPVITPDQPYVWVCSECRSDWVRVVDEERSCPQCRRVFLVPRSSNAHAANLLLLRYRDRLRVIVSSANMTTFHWQHLAQFGWYADIPVIISWSDSSEDVCGFELDLTSFLERLGVLNAQEYFSNVNFAVLSPCIQLIPSMPGDHGMTPPVMCGAKKLHHLTSKLPWPYTTDREKVCQTSRLGTASAAAIETIFKLSGVKSVYPSNLTVVYPSDRFAREQLGALSEEVQTQIPEVYTNADRDFHLIPYLHDLGTSQPVFPHANVYSEYQIGPDDGIGGQQRYGWVVVGAHTLGEAAWGKHRDRERGELFFFKYTLSVSVFPYVSEDPISGDVSVRAADLSMIPFLFHDLRPYGPHDHPYTPINRHFGEKMFKSIGKMMRVAANKPFGFIGAFPERHPLSTFYDQMPYQSSGVNSDLLIHVESCEAMGRLLPPIGQVVVFIAMFDNRRKAGKNCRVVYVLQVYSSEKEACADLKVEYASRPPVPSLVESSNWRADAVSVSGRQTEAAPSSSWRTEMVPDPEPDKFAGKSRNLQQRLRRQICPTQSDMEQNLAMRPTRLRGDMDWLGKICKDYYDGWQPNLIWDPKGMFSLDVLGGRVVALRKHIIHRKPSKQVAEVAAEVAAEA